MRDATTSSPVVGPRRRPVRVSPGGAVISLLVSIILALLVGGLLLYASEERAIADARQASASVSEQLKKSQQETRDSQAQLDSLRQQLASSQGETAAAQAAGKDLSDQLAQAQQELQQVQAQAGGLQAEKDDLTNQLSAAQKATDDAQTANTALQARTRRALAKAQLVAEFLSLSAQGSSDATQFLTWFRKLGVLNDPTVNQYANEYYDAIKKNPKDTKAFGAMLEKIVVYLSGSIVDDLQ